MLTSDFDYELPPGLIAQHPLPERDASHMMVVDRAAGSLAHGRITDLPGYLRPGDILALNDTRVFPARLRGVREDTGGQVEVLLLQSPAVDASPGCVSDPRPPTSGIFPALLKSGFTPRPGLHLSLADGAIRGEITAVRGEGRIDVLLEANGRLADVVDAHGDVPLPPYIRRDNPDETLSRRDRSRYQTVYATRTGAVAAPTAGLHFTDALLDAVRSRGVGRTTLTLHVGPGTFRPVKTDDVEEHAMEAEWYEVSETAARALRDARSRGGRVLAVGTTTVRTLETVAGGGAVTAASGWTRLFICPPYTFRAVDMLLTNFHLPRSTLLMLVSAFAGATGRDGRELILEAYRTAIAERYRFYSYGDCMLIV